MRPGVFEVNRHNLLASNVVFRPAFKILPVEYHPPPAAAAPRRPLKSVLQASLFCLLGCLLLGWGESQFGDRKILGQAKGQVKFLYTILTFPGGK